MSKAKAPPRIRQFECTVKGTNWVRNIHATTRSKARYRYWQDIRESWDDVKLIHVEARVVPVSTPEYVRCTLDRRGIYNARVGMKVEVEGKEGIILGTNDSSNLEVMFGAGTKDERIAYCHPRWETVYYDDNGEIVYDFRANKT